MSEQYLPPEEVFDHFAPNYDETVNSPGYCYVGVEKLFNVVSGFLSENPEAVILDVGCGTGLVGQKLKSEFSGATIHGIDISKRMLAQAQNKGVYASLKKVNLEEDVFDFTTSSVDLVVAGACYDYIRNLSPSFNEIGRVLKPEGIVSMTTFAGLTDESQRMEEILKLLNSVVGEGPFESETFEHSLDYILSELMRASVSAHHLDTFIAYNCDHQILNNGGGTFYHLFSGYRI